MIYIVIRETTDWEDEATVTAQLPEGFAPTVALWNDTFNLPFHLFRSELKKISQLSHSRVEGASVVPLEDVPEGAWVAPSDDDDWFSPDLVSVLEPNLDAGYSGACWPTRFLEVPIDWIHEIGLLRGAILASPPSTWTCTSNNHALKNDPEMLPLTASHVAASRWFDQHSGRIKKLDTPLSIQNRHLGSMTSLRFRWKRQGMTRPMLIRKFQRYRKLYASRGLSDELAWARPYVDLVAQLMDELHVKK